MFIFFILFLLVGIKLNNMCVVVFSFSGLNFAEIIQRQGIYPSPKKPPFVMGMECAGTVEELGENVTDLEVKCF